MVNQVGLWEFNAGADVLDDKASLDNDAQLIGNAADTGKGSVDLDGTGDYIKIDHDTSYDLKSATVVVGFQFDTLGGTAGILSRDSQGYDGGGHLTLEHQGDGVLDLLWQSGTTSYHITSAKGALQPGVEYTVQISFDAESNTIEMYLNDTLVGNVTAPVTLEGNAEPWVLGAGQTQSGDASDTGTNEFMDGQITHFEIWDDALTPAQLTVAQDAAAQIHDLTDGVDQGEIEGTDGDDTIYGGPGDGLADGGAVIDDNILGGAGNDKIFAGDGDDVILGGADNDTIYGGSGNDIIGATGSNSTPVNLIQNGSFEDGTHGANGVNGLDGWTNVSGSPDSADDGTTAESWNPSLSASEGTGYITMWSSNTGPAEAMKQTLATPLQAGTEYTLNVQAHGGEYLNSQWFTPSANPVRFDILDTDTGAILGSTTINSATYQEYSFTFTPSTDVSTITLRPHTLGSGNNPSVTIDELSLYATNGDDVVTPGGEDGDDTIFGEDGNDTIYAGQGDDKIFGGAGQDYIEGGTGHDTISGGADADIIRGESGSDTLDYTDSDAGVTVDLNTTATIQGVEFTQGFGGHAEGDLIRGMDNITGSDYADDLRLRDITSDADPQNTFASGGAGDDYIVGGAGANVLQGGDDKDTIVAGSGDTVDGGAGFTPGEGKEIVTEAEADQDTLVVTNVKSVNISGVDSNGNGYDGTVTFNDDTTMSFVEIENFNVNGSVWTPPTPEVTINDAVVLNGGYFSTGESFAPGTGADDLTQVIDGLTFDTNTSGQIAVGDTTVINGITYTVQGGGEAQIRVTSDGSGDTPGTYDTKAESLLLEDSSGGQITLILPYAPVDNVDITQIEILDASLVTSGNIIDEDDVASDDAVTLEFPAAAPPTIDLDQNASTPAGPGEAGSDFVALNINSAPVIENDGAELSEGGVGETARYQNVATVDGQSVDLIATVVDTYQIDANGDRGVDANPTFDVQRDEDGDGTANVNFTSNSYVKVIWTVVESGTTNPVNGNFSVLINDLDGSSDMTRFERVTVDTNELDSYALDGDTDIVKIEDGTKLTFQPNTADPGAPGFLPANSVQLTFTNTSNFTIEYEKLNTGGNVGLDGEFSSSFFTNPEVVDTNPDFGDVFKEGAGFAEIGSDNVAIGGDNLTTLTITPRSGSFPDGADEKLVFFNAGNLVTVPLDGSQTGPFSITVNGQVLNLTADGDSGAITITAQGGGIVPDTVFEKLISDAKYLNTSDLEPGLDGVERMLDFVVTNTDGLSSAPATTTLQIVGIGDGIVSGTAAGDLIDTNYVGDPDGDLVDANDALLPGEVGNDDLIEAGEGDDIVYANDGDDEIAGGGGNDVLIGGAGDDVIYGDADATSRNLIVNGSFENTTGMSNTPFGKQSTGSMEGWTTANPASVIDIHQDGRGGVQATDGIGWADLASSPGAIRIGQDVAGAVPGETYVLTFDAGDATVLAGGDENGIEVYWGGTKIATIDPPNDGSMQTYTFNVVGGAGDGSDRLEFSGLPDDDDNLGASLDNIQLRGLVAGDSDGNDLLEGGTGVDVLYGEGGDDILNTADDGTTGDQAYGGLGDDTFMASGNDYVDGGEDPDGQDMDRLIVNNVDKVEYYDGTGAITSTPTESGIVTFNDGTTMTFDNIEQVLADPITATDIILLNLPDNGNPGAGSLPGSGDVLTVADNELVEVYENATVSNGNYGLPNLIESGDKITLNGVEYVIDDIQDVTATITHEDPSGATVTTAGAELHNLVLYNPADGTFSTVAIPTDGNAYPKITEIEITAVNGQGDEIVDTDVDGDDDVSLAEVTHAYDLIQLTGGVPVPGDILLGGSDMTEVDEPVSFVQQDPNTLSVGDTTTIDGVEYTVTAIGATDTGSFVYDGGTEVDNLEIAVLSLEGPGGEELTYLVPIESPNIDLPNITQFSYSDPLDDKTTLPIDDIDSNDNVTLATPVTDEIFDAIQLNGAFPTVPNTASGSDLVEVDEPLKVIDPDTPGELSMGDTVQIGNDLYEVTALSEVTASIDHDDQFGIPTTTDGVTMVSVTMTPVTGGTPINYMVPCDKDGDFPEITEITPTTGYFPVTSVSLNDPVDHDIGGDDIVTLGGTAETTVQVYDAIQIQNLDNNATYSTSTGELVDVVNQLNVEFSQSGVISKFDTVSLNGIDYEISELSTGLTGDVTHTDPATGATVTTPDVDFVFLTLVDDDGTEIGYVLPLDSDGDLPQITGIVFDASGMTAVTQVTTGVVDNDDIVTLDTAEAGPFYDAIQMSLGVPDEGDVYATGAGDLVAIQEPLTFSLSPDGAIEPGATFIVGGQLYQVTTTELVKMDVTYDNGVSTAVNVDGYVIQGTSSDGQTITFTLPKDQEGNLPDITAIEYTQVNITGEVVVPQGDIDADDVVTLADPADLPQVFDAIQLSNPLTPLVNQALTTEGGQGTDGQTPADLVSVEEPIAILEQDDPTKLTQGDILAWNGSALEVTSIRPITADYQIQDMVIPDVSSHLIELTDPDTGEVTQFIVPDDSEGSLQNILSIYPTSIGAPVASMPFPQIDGNDPVSLAPADEDEGPDGPAGSVYDFIQLGAGSSSPNDGDILTTDDGELVAVREPIVINRSTPGQITESDTVSFNGTDYVVSQINTGVDVNYTLENGTVVNADSVLVYLENPSDPTDVQTFLAPVDLEGDLPRITQAELVSVGGDVTSIPDATLDDNDVVTLDTTSTFVLHDFVQIDAYPNPGEVKSVLDSDLLEVDEPILFNTASAGEIQPGDTTVIDGVVYTVTSTGQWTGQVALENGSTPTVSGGLLTLEDPSGGTISYAMPYDQFGDLPNITQITFTNLDNTLDPTLDQTNLDANDFVTLICFAGGTHILTNKGEIKVEDLALGDKVLTRDSGYQQIKWIGKTKVDGRAKFAPVTIKQGTFGNERDLTVSPQHRVLVCDWRAELMYGEFEVLIAAKHLTNIDGIYTDPRDEVEYFHILFDRHEVIFSEGIPTESFHPGDYSVKGMGDETREELFALFPELAKGAANYGPSARISLKRREALQLIEEMGLKQPIH